MNNIDQCVEIVNENSSIENERSSVGKAAGVIRVTVKLPTARHPSGREWKFSDRITVIRTKEDQGFNQPRDKEEAVLFRIKSDVASCPAPIKSFADACNDLSATDLRKAYPHEANCHMNMLARRKKVGAIVHDDFLNFRSFLKIVGQAPDAAATLDRIDNDNKMYGPSLVRWADKATQNNNKGDSRKIIDAATGRVYSPADVAEKQGLGADTVRKRIRRGWTAEKILTGKQVKSSPEKPVQSIANPEYKPAAPPFEESYAVREARQLKEAYERTRAEEGSEAIMADYEALLDLIPDLTADQYEGKFRLDWAKHRLHLDYDNLKNESLSQWELIARIDPDYVAEWNRKKVEGPKYSDLL
jgi:hypothetical protein